MKNIIDRSFDKNVISDVVIDKSKPIVAEEMGDICGIAGYQIIDANDRMTFGEQAITKMRTEKSGTAHDNAGLFRH